MNKPVPENRGLTPEVVSAMKKLTAGAPDLALKASLDFCITVLNKHGFTPEEIEKFINNLTGEALRRFQREIIDSSC